ncbi:hypothetical protein D3C77_488360 [compost metagenome]
MPVIQQRIFNRAAAQDAGIIEQNIQTPMPITQIGHHLLPVAFTAGIVTNKGGGRAYLGGKGLACLFINVADHHLRAFCRQQPRASAANTVCTACDQGNFALYSSTHIPVLVGIACAVSRGRPASETFAEAAAQPARRPEKTQSAKDRPLIYRCDGMPSAVRPAA